MRTAAEDFEFNCRHEPAIWTPDVRKHTEKLLQQARILHTLLLAQKDGQSIRTGLF